MVKVELTTGADKQHFGYDSVRHKKLKPTYNPEKVWKIPFANS